MRNPPHKRHFQLFSAGAGTEGVYVTAQSIPSQKNGTSDLTGQPAIEVGEVGDALACQMAPPEVVPSCDDGSVRTGIATVEYPGFAGVPLPENLFDV